jgi:hypothetical protein
VQSFLQDWSVSIREYNAAELKELKEKMFPGLVKESVKEQLLKYQGAVEFPYRSEFDSQLFQEEMARRKN